VYIDVIDLDEDDKDKFAAKKEKEIQKSNLNLFT
jgi:hypothetical protein